jgi:hypothetical protein
MKTIKVKQLVTLACLAATLLLADGTYLLDVPALDIRCPVLVIRSASGNRDAVTVRGPLLEATFHPPAEHRDRAQLGGELRPQDWVRSGQSRGRTSG